MVPQADDRAQHSGQEPRRCTRLQRDGVPTTLPAFTLTSSSWLTFVEGWYSFRYPRSRKKLKHSEVNRYPGSSTDSVVTLIDDDLSPDSRKLGMIHCHRSG